MIDKKWMIGGLILTITSITLLFGSKVVPFGIPNRELNVDKGMTHQSEAAGDGYKYPSSNRELGNDR